MRNFKYVIIGGGTTAGYAAAEFARQGIEKGELCIISRESILPMNRPPLSKGFITGANTSIKDILINDQNFYDKHGIEVLLQENARHVDFQKKIIRLQSGKDIAYEYLLLATGSELRYLNLNDNNLDNVFYLRTAVHANKIREAAKKSEKVIVIGGQFIGTEVAAALSQLGKEVTMIFPEDRILSQFASADIAAFIQNYFRDNGIEIINHDEVVQINGEEKVEEVELRSDDVIKTDMVIAGIGVEPNIKAVKNTNIALDDGILVNEYLETNIPDVYAAGDVARFPDKIFDKMRRVEHWENAFEQGKHAAKVMSGRKEPYEFIPFFFSDIFDLSYEYFGDNKNAQMAYNRGNIANGDFSTWWFRNNKLIAAFIMNSRPEKEGEKAREWIRSKTLIDHEKIINEDIELDELTKKY